MPVRFPFATPIVPASAVHWVEEFKAKDSNLRIQWQLVTSVTMPADADANEFGRTPVNVTAAGTNNRLYQAPASFLVPTTGWPFNPFWLFQCDVRYTALSDGTDQYTTELGMLDTAVPTAVGVGFSYTHTANGGKWVCFAVNGGAPSVINTIYTPAISPSINRFRVWSFTPGLVAFMVNDATVGTLNTNIPTGALLGPQVKMSKQAGAATRGASVDYAGLYYYDS